MEINNISLDKLFCKPKSLNIEDKQSLILYLIERYPNMTEEELQLRVFLLWAEEHINVPFTFRLKKGVE